MRHHLTCISIAALLAAGVSACAGSNTDERPDPAPASSTPLTEAPETPAEGTPEAPATKAEAPVERPKPLDPLRHQPNLPPEKRLVVVIDGEERIVDIDVAKKAGYTPVDFSRDWTPYIFEERTGEDGELLYNRYRKIFIGLANDETDGDGRPLDQDEELNFLEVFGIPPSMGVIRSRFLADAEKDCFDDIDFAAIGKVERIPYLRGNNLRRWNGRVNRAKRAVDKAIKKANAGIKKANKARRKTNAAIEKAQAPDAPPGALEALGDVKIEAEEPLIETMDDLKNRAPKIAGTVEESMELVQLDADRKVAFDHLERRLKCDEHDRKRYKHKKGKFDHGLRMGLRRFQRKHKLYSYANMKGDTLGMMSKPPLETNFLAFERVLTERIVSATHIIEDGTTQVGDKVPTYVGSDGEEKPIRNLVQEFVEAAKTQLDLTDGEKVLAFFRRYSKEDMTWLRVGVKFPELPEYYTSDMDLKIVIDRGDVWYDLPYDDEGNELKQPRRRLPKLMVYLRWNDQTIRLVRWPTTIGGWRKDLAPNGYVYMRYKGSDIGDRVIRKIISGPTWVPPESTPLKSMAKRRWINGKAQGVVNYEEMGPGYLSAYGLVAGYFVIPGKNGRDHDRGIRAHGSSDYMSIRSSQRFSHGCHRLLNHLSVRLYGFIINHRPHRVAGDQPINHTRQFYHKEQVYQVRLPSRGFAYFLDPPIEVTVTEGNIKGKRKRPYEGYVKIPGEMYPDMLPGESAGGEDDRAGGGTAGGGDAAEDDT